MTSQAQTALVLKFVTRCEFGEDLSLGYIAEPFDRVRVTRSVTFSSGGRSHYCVTDAGEKFFASEAMVQTDAEPQA